MMMEFYYLGYFFRNKQAILNKYTICYTNTYYNCILVVPHKPVISSENLAVKTRELFSTHMQATWWSEVVRSMAEFLSDSKQGHI